QHQGWKMLTRQAYPLLGSLGLECAVTLCLQHIAHELAVEHVVLDDEDQAGVHDCIGSENVKVEPLPSSLSTRMRPPCNSTNLRASVRPRPVPSRLCRALSPTCRNSSKIASWSCGAIPMPVSVTETSTTPSTRPARTSTRPPSGVNFT